jgi:hypothetical protein
MFIPKSITSSKELPEGWFIYTMVSTFDDVALFVAGFTNKYGEPTEGYVWQEGKYIHVYLRNEETNR